MAGRIAKTVAAAGSRPLASCRIPRRSSPLRRRSAPHCSLQLVERVRVEARASQQPEWRTELCRSLVPPHQSTQITAQASCSARVLRCNSRGVVVPGCGRGQHTRRWPCHWRITGLDPTNVRQIDKYSRSFCKYLACRRASRLGSSPRVTPPRPRGALICRMSKLLTLRQAGAAGSN